MPSPVLASESFHKYSYCQHTCLASLIVNGLGSRCIHLGSTNIEPGPNLKPASALTCPIGHSSASMLGSSHFSADAAVGRGTGPFLCPLNQLLAVHRTLLASKSPKKKAGTILHTVDATACLLPTTIRVSHFLSGLIYSAPKTRKDHGESQHHASLQNIWLFISAHGGNALRVSVRFQQRIMSCVSTAAQTIECPLVRSTCSRPFSLGESSTVEAFHHPHKSPYNNDQGHYPRRKKDERYG